MGAGLAYYKLNQSFGEILTHFYVKKHISRWITEKSKYHLGKVPVCPPPPLEHVGCFFNTCEALKSSIFKPPQ